MPQEHLRAPWFCIDFGGKTFSHFPDVLTLTEQVHRLKTVMRLKPGSAMNLIDLQTQIVYQALIQTVSAKNISVELIAKQEKNAPKVKITAAVSLIKANRWEEMLQKLTELAVTTIQPLITERTIIRDAKHERWEQILIQAAEQSEQSRIPEIKPPLKLSEWIRTLDEPSLKLVPIEPYTQEGLPPLKSVVSHFTSAVYAIGPEGGWTAHEVKLFQHSGFIGVSLGDTILRSETAAIFMASILRYEHDAL